MKIKKGLVLGLSVLAIVGMVGCSSSGSTTTNSKDNKENVLKDESNKKEASKEFTYLGKVKSVVGNEIEIELAKDQDIGGNDSKSKGEVQFEESVGEGSESASGEIKSMTENDGETIKQDSVSMPSDGGEVFEFGKGGEDKKVELEYTGKTMKITVPTGASIFDMRSRSESKLSAIKANSIIKIFANGTKDDLAVKSINIVE